MASKWKRLIAKENTDVFFNFERPKFVRFQRPGIRALTDKYSVGQTQMAHILANTNAVWKTWVAYVVEKRKRTELQRTEILVFGSEMWNWCLKLRFL